jgi:hypothetical protein
MRSPLGETEEPPNKVGGLTTNTPKSKQRVIKAFEGRQERY